MYKDGTLFRAQSQAEKKFISMDYRASTDYTVDGYDLLTISFQIEFFANSVINPQKSNSYTSIFQQKIIQNVSIDLHLLLTNIENSTMTVDCI